jgi:hypothetical protein
MRQSEISYPCHTHGMLHCAAASAARGAGFALIVLEFIDVFARGLPSHVESK